MNLNDPNHPWARLMAAARQAPDDRDTSAPYGFATRIAALALAQEQRVLSLFERFAFRAVGVSCVLALSALALNYSTVVTHLTTVGVQEEEALPVDDADAIAVVLDLAD